MKDVKFKTGEWSSIVNGVSELKDVDIITLVQELGTITNDAKDACDRYDVDNAIDIESMDGVLMDDLDERIAKLAQKTFKIQDTLPADIDQPFYDSMDSLIEKLSNMNIMGYETMARGSFSNGVNSAGVAMPKMKVTLEDLLGSSSPLTDYLRVEYDKMKQEIGDISFEDYQKMAFADTSFDYYSRNEKVKDLAVTIVINGAVLVIGGMLPWQLMVALGLTSGAKNVSDAWRGKDLFTGKELSTGDRILRGLSGIADLALAGYGTYKGLKPLKGTNRVVVSEKTSGANVGKNLQNQSKNLRNNLDDFIKNYKNSDEYLNLSNSQRKIVNRKLDRLGKGNVATAEVDIPGLKKDFKAHSQVHSNDSLGYMDDFSIAPSEKDRVLKNYVEDGYPRYNDTEAKILEDIASKIKDPNIKGEINLFSELDCCQSCTNLILEFRKKYPNIKINVITNNTLK